MNLVARVEELAEDIRSYPKLLQNIKEDAISASIYDPELISALENTCKSLEPILEIPLPTEVTTKEKYVLQSLAFIGTDTNPSLTSFVNDARQYFHDVFAHAQRYECLTHSVRQLTTNRPSLHLRHRPDTVLRFYARALPRAYTEYRLTAAELLPNHAEPLESHGPTL